MNFNEYHGTATWGLSLTETYSNDFATYSLLWRIPADLSSWSLFMFTTHQLGPSLSKSHLCQLGRPTPWQSYRTANRDSTMTLSNLDVATRYPQTCPLRGVKARSLLIAWSSFFLGLVCHVPFSQRFQFYLQTVPASHGCLLFMMLQQSLKVLAHLWSWGDGPIAPV